MYLQEFVKDRRAAVSLGNGMDFQNNNPIPELPHINILVLNTTYCENLVLQLSPLIVIFQLEWTSGCVCGVCPEVTAMEDRFWMAKPTSYSLESIKEAEERFLSLFLLICYINFIDLCIVNQLCIAVMNLS